MYLSGNTSYLLLTDFEMIVLCQFGASVLFCLKFKIIFFSFLIDEDLKIHQWQKKVLKFSYMLWGPPSPDRSLSSGSSVSFQNVFHLKNLYFLVYKNFHF